MLSHPDILARVHSLKEKPVLCATMCVCVRTHVWIYYIIILYYIILYDIILYILY